MEYQAPKKMVKIGDLFIKYKKRFVAPQASVEKEVIDSVYTQTGYKLDKTKVSYKVSTRIVTLNIPSVLKSEVLFKQQEILKELEKTLGQKNGPKKIL